MNSIFKHKLIRYLFSGGTAAAVNIGLLFIFTHFLGLYYILSGILAFCCAVVVSFYMQKKWTFEDHATEDTHKKFGIFVAVAIINLCANTLILYIATDFFHIHYIVSQVIASGLVAIWSFFIYRVMFKQSTTDSLDSLA